MNEYTPFGESRRDDVVSLVHDQYHSSLEFYARGLCQRFNFDSGADDVLQIFYIKVMEKSKMVQQGLEEKGYPYLCQMVKNICLDLDRKKKSQGRLKEGFKYQAQNFNSIHYLCAEIYTESFLDGLSRYLTQRDAAIMELYLRGFSYDEIGKKVKMGSSTVGVRIHRAKKILAKQIGRSH